MDDEICAALEAGETLRELCKARSHLPDRATVQRWRTEDPEFHARLTAARARGCDALTEESLAISDDAAGDLTTDKEGNPVANHAAIARAKLRIDTRLKIAALWNPKEYGARQQVDVNATISLEALVLGAIGLAQPAISEPLNITNMRPLPADDIRNALQGETYDDLL